MLVVAEELGLDPVPVEQAFRMPRVLAQDDVGSPQLVEHAKRHVLEVADRGRADRERHLRLLSDRLEREQAGADQPASEPSSALTIRMPARAGSSASRTATS